MVRCVHPQKVHGGELLEPFGSLTRSQAEVFHRGVRWSDERGRLLDELVSADDHVVAEHLGSEFEHAHFVKPPHGVQGRQRQVSNEREVHDRS